MKQLLALPVIASLFGSSSDAPAPEPEWKLDYTRICTFELESDTEKPEKCDQFTKYWLLHDDDGRSYVVYHYKWVGENGREVIYEPHIGGFGVSIFTIGVLHDNFYKGGYSFDPAVSHSLHRSLTVLGAPNEIYSVTVEDIRTD